jgi:uncharacterized protein with LGFP repeats
VSAVVEVLADEGEEAGSAAYGDAGGVAVLRGTVHRRGRAYMGCASGLPVGDPEARGGGHPDKRSWWRRRGGTSLM